jgi:hypothetical protein
MPVSAKVSPRSKNPTHDIVLKIKGQSYGIKCDPPNIKEVPQTPTTLRLTAGGGSGNKFGDYDPSMAHIQQSDWSGGQGQEEFSRDPARYVINRNCWTLTPEMVLPGPQHVYGRNLVLETSTLPRFNDVAALISDVDFKALVGTFRYIASSFSPTTTFSADKCQLYIRAVGTPGTLTLEIRNTSGGNPNGSVLKSATVTAFSDPISQLYTFDWSGTQSLTSGTTYWVVAYGASTDNAFNHWEVAISPKSTVYHSSDGSTWTSGLSSLLYRISAVEVDRSFIFFEMDSALYAVDRRSDGTASKLYINGNRGKATGATATTLTDSNAAFTAEVNPNYMYVRIIRGTGVGQIRVVSSSTATELTVSTWDITPDTTSEYVVFRTEVWTEITGHGLTGVVTSVAVSGLVAYLAQGSAINVRRIRFNPGAATPIHEYAADGSNKADLLYTFYDQPSKKSQVWRALNGSTVQVSRAEAKSWGTDLTFGTNIDVGTKQFLITGFTDYDGQLVVTKEDSVWTIVNDIPLRKNVGLGSSPHPDNGKAVTSLGLFLYFNYMHSLEQLNGSTLSDIGPWRGSGIPSGFTGTIVALTSAFNWLFAAVDAGTGGTSGVYCYDGTSWHGIFLAPTSNTRIRSLYWQACPGASPILWIAVGAYIVGLRFPKDTLNPLNDSTFAYHHDCRITLSTIDMDSYVLPKYINEISVVSKNLFTNSADGVDIFLDYQVDEDIGGSVWIPIGFISQSPLDTLPIGLGNIRQIRLRLLLRTADTVTPPIIRATVLEGFARTPVKYQYNIAVKERPQQLNRRGGRDIDPDTMYAILREAAETTTPVFMTARYKSMDGRRVIVEPPTLVRQSANSQLSSWSGVLSLTVRDA